MSPNKHHHLHIYRGSKAISSLLSSKCKVSMGPTLLNYQHAPYSLTAYKIYNYITKNTLNNRFNRTATITNFELVNLCFIYITEIYNLPKKWREPTLLWFTKIKCRKKEKKAVTSLTEHLLSGCDSSTVPLCVRGQSWEVSPGNGWSTQAAPLIFPAGFWPWLTHRESGSYVKCVHTLGWRCLSGTQRWHSAAASWVEPW